MNTINIAPNLSVYKLTKRSLRDVSVISGRRTMNIISNQIENSTLIDGAETVIFAAFQRYSRFKPQMKRYRQLAKQSNHIYVFGVPDEDLPPIENITYVPLNENDQLAKEWFLISYGRDYFTALATEEVTHIDDPDDKRQFKGIWTFDIAIVSMIYDWMAQAVGMIQYTNPRDNANHTRQAQLLSNIMGRLSVRLLDDKPKDRPIHDEIQTIMKDGLYPILKYLEEANPLPKN
ncbi:MAG: DICT sensory domain-containing protein [Phototrophicaceae bacterium]